MSYPLINPRPGMILLRALVWSLIGLIYAPLFTGLQVLFLGFGLGHAAFIPAAAIAGAVGATFYGARQVALLGTLIGLMVAAVTFALLPGPVGLWHLAAAAGLLGAVLGALVRFPDRCSRHVPGKALAGLVTGIVCGGLLALVEPLHPENFDAAGAVAFLVAVNGVLYVATVPWWVRRMGVGCGRPCNVVESMVIALLAATAAGSMWVVVGPMVGVVHEAYHAALDTMVRLTPGAAAGGLLGGAVTGALLEAFGFRWVHDV